MAGLHCAIILVGCADAQNSESGKAEGMANLVQVTMNGAHFRQLQVWIEGEDGHDHQQGEEGGSCDHTTFPIWRSFCKTKAAERGSPMPPGTQSAL